MNNYLIKVVTLFIFASEMCSSHNPSENRKIEFPDLPGFKTVVCDLHMHSVFSDGSVWPDIRIDEAKKDGVDVMHMIANARGSDFQHRIK